MTRIIKGFKATLKSRRRLRNEMTQPEKNLWSRLRSQQFQSLKFRRQHGIGPYVVDFYCPEKLTVVEIDGESHTEEQQITLDAERAAYLRSLGLQVIRYTNHEILENMEGVLSDLQEKILSGSTSPDPSLQRRGNNNNIPPLCKPARSSLGVGGGRIGGVEPVRSTSLNPSLQRRGKL